MNTRIYSVVWLLLLGVACSAYAQSNKVERQRQLEPTIKTFEEADKTKPARQRGSAIHRQLVDRIMEEPPRGLP